ncbi:MAG: hypothetical protein PWP46_2205 [Fusobacteriaceae bacterium]|jgi:hypothetical protein|nr:hypothetical protein [Fusobacteriales bacterium]MDN5305318.1 hypothetical protein [Fusobacteriaceae bacterium]
MKTLLLLLALLLLIKRNNFHSKLANSCVKQ